MASPTDTAVRLDASLDDAKLVYRVLHAELTRHLELMDCDLFGALQTLLQERARAAGVDVTDHAAWDAWLGNENATPCGERVAGRRVLD
jgi:hypothetical protein